MSSPFYDFIAAAMEAGDDLTRETRAMMRGTVRSAGQNPNTDDSIEGGGMNDLGGGLNTDPSGNPDNPDDMGDGNDDMGEGDLGDDMGGGMDDFGGGMGGDDMSGMGDDGMGGSDMISGADGSGEMSPKYAYHIVNLQTNAMALYNSVSTLITSLTEYAVPTSTPEVKRLYNNALDHLTVIKTSLEEILGSPFRVNTYASKMRKYMTVRHAYSLTMDQLLLYFEALNVENDRSTEKS